MSPYLASDVPDPFVGRAAVRQVLWDEVDRNWGHAATKFLLHSPAGYGSTATAVVIGRDDEDSAQPRFADGSVYLSVNRPGTGTPAPIGELFGTALTQLPDGPVELPESDEAREGLYRRYTRNRRLLVVLDGVTVPEQIDRLVPHSRYAMVIVTGRRQFDLLGDGFRRVRVPALVEAESRELLAALLREDIRRIAEPTVTAILRLCAGNPLAIHIVARSLDQQPTYAERFLADAREYGVEAFEDDGVRVLAIALDASYEGLTAAQATAYRLLSAHPGPDFAVPAAAALLGWSDAATERTLHQLAKLNLLTVDDAGRYGWLELIRSHAHGRLRRTDPPEQTRAALGRVLDWYWQHSAAAIQAVLPRWQVADAFRRVPPASGGRAGSLHFLDTERINLERAVRVANEYGFLSVATDLCCALWAPYRLRAEHTSALATYGVGIEAATARGDWAGVMQVANQRGAAHLGLGELDPARAAFRHSLELAVRIGYPLGVQSGLEWLGKIEFRAGDTAEAVRLLTESRQVEVPDEHRARVRAILCLQFGRVRFARGELAASLDELAAAWTYFRAGDEADNKAKVRYETGRALLASGDPANARDALRDALGWFTDDHSVRWAAHTRRQLADADHELGDRDAERADLSAAAELYASLGDDEAESRARRRLTELG